MDKNWINKSRCSDEYKVGVGQFLEFAFRNSSHDGKILCPCKYCVNRFLHTYEETRMHLICDGFIKGYTRWSCHGENSSSNASTSSTPIENAQPCRMEYVQEQPNQPRLDDMVGLLRDAIGMREQVNDNVRLDINDDMNVPYEGINLEQPRVDNSGESNEFSKLLEDVHKEVYS